MNIEQDDTRQQQVIEAAASARILVHAGPGTGKTQVSALRLAKLVHSGMRPSQILVLSFSRSAVKTLAKRLENLPEQSAVVSEDLRHLSIRTFDSWTFRILRQMGEQPDQLMARSYEQNIQALVDLIARDGASVKELLSNVRHVIIDEFQDLPGVRARLVLALLRLLAPPGELGAGFTVLGDHVQAIYGFAARFEDQNDEAQQDGWEALRNCYGATLQEIELERNFRSVPALAQLTAGLREILRREISGSEKLAQISEVIAQLPASSAVPSPEWLTCMPEGSVAILTRTNGEALRVAQHLLGRSVEGPPVAFNLQLAGQRHPSPAWISALLSPLRAGQLPRSQFEKIHAYCRQKLGEQGCQTLRLPSVETSWIRLLRASGASDSDTVVNLDALRQRLDWPDAFPDDHVLSEASLTITTIHQSKGMEFDSVALLRHESEDAEDPQEHPEEEASVFFVGITRAAKHLGVIPAAGIHRPPTVREFAKGMRSRLYRFWSGWVNLEMGLPNDIRTSSVVDVRVHGSEEKVDEIQQMLMSRGDTLRGHKVMLCRMSDPDNPTRVAYGIHLQNDNQPGQLIAMTANQVTVDLLSVLHDKGYSLPGRIMNLRIGDVVSLAGPEECPPHVPEPYRTSRLWLGITLFGTGDFQTWKRKN
jgi:DNA helicase II / ATP-dependent DNA helicase PcrA